MNLIKPFLLLVLVPAIGFSAHAQKVEANIVYLTNTPDQSNSIIIYDQQRKLAIEDFKGQPEEESVAAAITHSGFMFKAGYRNANGKASLSITVYCSFDKQLSWMKAKAKNPYILSHEQHHFDITYISTLLFMKKIKQVHFRQEDYKVQLQDTYNEAIGYMRQLQHQYDTETNNGILKDRQALWDKKIDEQLLGLVNNSD